MEHVGGARHRFDGKAPPATGSVGQGVAREDHHVGICVVHPQAGAVPGLAPGAELHDGPAP